MPGLEINLQKSELLLVLDDAEKQLNYAQLFNCHTGTWPIKYLGMPVGPDRLLVSDWSMLEEKFLKRLDGWKSNTLSLGGRVTVINSCLTSSPVYHMSMHLLPKTIIAKLDKIRRRLVW